MNYKVDILRSDCSSPRSSIDTLRKKNDLKFSEIYAKKQPKIASLINDDDDVIFAVFCINIFQVLIIFVMVLIEKSR